TYQGKQVYDGYFAGWNLKAAETINGVNQVAWQHASGDLSISDLVVWVTDASWDLIASTSYNVNSSNVFQWEMAFDQDFNNDLFIGSDPLA
ncbi:hypothetical protein N8630_02945, partial [Synechococcus sp. AH-601-C19]|nr:hypothetical protein [Synechococcus sp. AH-601-C19]